MFASVFIWMLHLFHTYITCILSGCCIYFAMVFSSVFKCFYKCFRHMLQVFQLFRTYVANISFGYFKSRSRREHMLRLRAAAPVWVSICFKSMLLLHGSPCRHGSPRCRVLRASMRARDHAACCCCSVYACRRGSPLYGPVWFLQTLLKFLSHRMFRHIHRVLNID